jgi:subtilisin family serine protease
MKKVTLTCVMALLGIQTVSLSAQNVQFAASDELLIRFQDGVSQDFIDSLRIAYHADSLGITPHSRIQLWKVSPPFNTTGFASIIEMSEDAKNKSPRVTSADPNYRTHNWSHDEENQIHTSSELLEALLQEGCSNCMGYSLRGLNDMRVNGEVKIAIMDSGIDGDFEEDGRFNFHPNHLPIFGDMYDTHSQDFVGSNRYTPKDYLGHGTHVTGIIAKILRVSPAADYVKLLILRTQDDAGYGSLWNLCRAFDYAIEQGATIANLSLSWYAPKRKHRIKKGDILKEVDNQLDNWNDVLKDSEILSDKDILEAEAEKEDGQSIMYFLLNFVSEKGLLVIGAAGNDKVNVDHTRKLDVFPARLQNDNLITVTSTDCQEERRISEFANWGERSVDIAALGKKVYSTYLGGRFRQLSGTSMATPIVTAAAALLRIQEPQLRLDEIKDKILHSANRTEYLSEKVTSAGTVNILRLLDLPTPDPCENHERRQKMVPQNGLQKITTFPNPFTQNVLLNLTSDANTTAKILISNTLGQVVFEKEVPCQIGENLVEWQTEDLSSGMYVVQVQINQNIWTRKIVKQ